MKHHRQSLKMNSSVRFLNWSPSPPLFLSARSFHLQNKFNGANSESFRICSGQGIGTELQFRKAPCNIDTRQPSRQAQPCCWTVKYKLGTLFMILQETATQITQDPGLISRKKCGLAFWRTVHLQMVFPNTQEGKHLDLDTGFRCLEFIQNTHNIPLGYF